MSSGKVLLGLLAGVAVGATIGILFAPAKGSATRKRISEKSDDYAEELEEKFTQFIDSITGKFEAVKGEVTRMAENGKHKVEDAAEHVTAAVKSKL